ncbi:MAG TPA: hypothetical protein VNV42_07465 [Solirubrobacteraceae bacterium]|nr:hypothetical protein [Solirubrobacteraceae bacterium]
MAPTDAHPAGADSAGAAHPAGADPAGAHPAGADSAGAAHPTDAHPAGAATRRRRWVVRTLDRLLPGENPAGAVYGTITVGALLAAESSLRDTYPETVGAMVVALLVYWLAHSYAELLGGRIAARERLTVAGLAQALVRDWAIVRGAGAPLLALLIAWAVGAGQETGVTVALWTCVASLLAFELVAGLRARARPAELLLELCVGAAMGFGVILLRVLLH